MIDGHRGIRVMNDYSCGWPLWWLEGGMLERDDLELSAPLAATIRAWARHFNAQFDHLDGWKSAQARDAHVQMAEEVLAGLADEVGDDLEIHPRLWELED
ncbi:hypothetical protein [Demequina sp. NBRC 110051]|uniref:hypothetical protein n=1 Tax=Demequina sp. NBRC 110051 TaxID=1570340 RepID=UPI0009FD5CD0|nr:hypothetical protein [Demequina sp. NBRC 110051]